MAAQGGHHEALQNFHLFFTRPPVSPVCKFVQNYLKNLKFLDDCLWLDPPWYNKWVSLALAFNVGIYSHEPSSLFHHSVLVDLSVSRMMH